MEVKQTASEVILCEKSANVSTAQLFNNLGAFYASLMNEMSLDINQHCLKHKSEPLDLDSYIYTSVIKDTCKLTLVTEFKMKAL